MIINKSKYERQLESLNKWIANDCIGALDLVMRFGKTLIGALAADYFKNKIVIIVTPNEISYKTWSESISEYAKSNLISEDLLNLERVRLYTIHEILANNLKLDTCLLIVDEIHKFTTDKRFELIEGKIIKYKNILGLTGTYPRDKTNYYKFIKYLPIVDKIEDREAISKGWITNFIEYNLGVDMSENDKIVYEKYTIPITETLKLFKNKYKLFNTNHKIFENDYDLIKSCYHGKKIYIAGQTYELSATKIRDQLAEKQGWHKDLDISNDHNKERDLYWNPNNIYDRIDTFMKCVRDRDLLLVNNKNKLSTVIDIFDKFSIPTICFNGSNDFATKISEEINRIWLSQKDNNGNEIATVYHSTVRRPLIDEETGEYFKYKSGSKKGQVKIFGKDSLKKDAMLGMINGKYVFLSTVKALDESLNLPKLQQVITTSGTTNPTTYAQRNARGRTVDIYYPDKITRIINIYFKDFKSLISFNEKGEAKHIYSRDKRKLELRQEQNKHSIIWVDSIDEIS